MGYIGQSAAGKHVVNVFASNTVGEADFPDPQISEVVPDSIMNMLGKIICEKSDGGK